MRISKSKAKKWIAGTLVFLFNLTLAIWLFVIFCEFMGIQIIAFR